MTAQLISVYWFKRDLRLEDNDALLSAIQDSNQLLLVYIYEPSLEADHHYSDRHWRFVAESLNELNSQLKSYSTQILILNLEVISAFKAILEHYQIDTVYSAEETGIQLTHQRDIEFSKFCKEESIDWQEFQNGGVIRGLKNRDTWRNNWYAYMSAPIVAIPAVTSSFMASELVDKNLFSLNYSIGLESSDNMQKGGRTEGKKWENSFFEERLQYYSEYISKPELARFGCSRLSPYLAWGCISIREVYQRSIEMKQTSPYKKQLSAFRSRLRWQAHFIQKFEMEPRIEFEAFNKGYLELSQPVNDRYINAWKTGTTGYPLVDASIRAVVTTGYLNFRMRTMTVSFLVHHLFQHFSTVAAWLAQQFLDFEPGIHYAQFQMQAGFTATNRIRIYNPTKNALDHDPEAVFIKKWLPELADLPSNLAIEPWSITEMERELYNFELGRDYPNRVINVAETRKSALEKLYAIRKLELTQKEKLRILKVHTLKRKT